MRQSDLRFGRVSCIAAFSLLAVPAGASQPPPCGKGYDLDAPRRILLPPTEPWTQYGTALGDLDGDGLVDAVASILGAPHRLITYLARSPLCFEEVAAIEVPLAGTVTLADVDGDGRLDALVNNPNGDPALTVLAGAGDGTFALHATVRFAAEIRQLVVADLDGDGHRDIVCGGGSGLVAFGPSFTEVQHLTSGGVRIGGCVARDFDGDGSTDLLCSTGDSVSLFLFLTVGPRLFTRIPITGGPMGSPLYLMDTDGDGKTEVVGKTATGVVSIRVLREGDAWVAREEYLLEEAGMSLFLVADLDGDGVEDLASTTTNPQLVRLAFGKKRGGAIEFGLDVAAVFLPGDPEWSDLYDLAALDVDGDGARDLVSGLGFVPGGPPLRAIAARFQGMPDPVPAVAIDLDGDGRSDLIRNIGVLEVRPGGEGGLGDPVRGDASIPLSARLAAGRLSAGAAAPSILAIEGTRCLISEIGAGGKPSQVAELALPAPLREFSLLPAEGERPARLLGIEFATEEPTSKVHLLDIPAAGPFPVEWTFVAARNASDPRLADLDGDGGEDLVFALPGGAHIARGGPEGPLPGSVVVDITGAGGLLAMAVIDIEGDGATEIVVSALGPPYGQKGGIFILRRGTDGVWRPDASPILDLTATDLAVADLDGDGRPDLAAATGEGFQTFRNDGKGQLLRRASAPVRSLSGVVPADFDGDGFSDLASFPGLSIAFGGPGGSLIGPRQAGIFHESSVLPVLAADFDGDGRLDVAGVPERGGSVIDVCLSASGDSFQPAIVVSAVPSVHLLAAGDLDGDGKRDLIATSEAGAHFLGGEGDGLFEGPAAIPGIGSLSYSIAVGDLDGDGAEDLVAAPLAGGIAVCRGGAGFPGSGAAPAEAIAADAQAYDLSLADLDVDGNLDLLARWRGASGTGGEKYQVFPGEGDGGFGEGIDAFLPIDPGSRLLRDFDGDGIPDGILPSMTGTIILVKGKGGFRFEQVEAGEAGGSYSPFKVADVDGDGVLDVVGTGGEGLVFSRGIGGGKVEAPRFFFPSGIALLEDFDGDGRPGVLSSREGNLVIVAAAGRGYLEAVRVYSPTGEGGPAMAAGDIDGDGRAEMAIAGMSPGELRVARVDEERDLRILGRVPVPEIDSRKTGVVVAVRDVDRDGKGDVLLFLDAKVLLFRSRGDFTFDEKKVLAENVTGDDMAFGDVDRDGNEDIVLSGLSVLRGLGDGSFVLAGEGGPPSGPFTLGDFDGDGILDAAQTVGGPTFRISRGDGKGGFGGPEFVQAKAASPGGLGIGDFDGDGRADIAIGSYCEHPCTSSLAVWYGTAAGPLRKGEDLVHPGAGDHGIRMVAVADLDGDGFDDVAGADTGGFTLVFLGGPGGLRPGWTAALGPREPRLLLAARFSGGPAHDLFAAGSGNGSYILPGRLRGAPFRRGDANGDGKVNIVDPIHLLDFLYRGGPSSGCPDAADADDSGSVGVEDALLILRSIFLRGPRPAAPSAHCGWDPGGGAPGCEEHPPCATAG